MAVITRIVQSLYYKASEDGSVSMGAMAERTLDWMGTCPRKDEMINFSYLDSITSEDGVWSGFVRLVQHEVSPRGDVQIALTLEPRVLTQLDAFEGHLQQLQDAGFELKLEADDADRSE